jgi:trk system potassium uptake protein TrkH
MTVFVPDFGAKGIWISVFHSVSAFCNAGMDILSANSLCDYALNPTINIVTSLLIILGGIGYIVWWDVLRVIKRFPLLKFRCFRNLTLHSKIALSTSAVLILSGGVLFFLLEFNNPLTMQGLGFFDKLQLSFFQSITTRTAGFASIPQENLTNGSAIVSLMLMFIGGSPVGTAGGIKTVTLTVLIASAVSSIRGRAEVSLFRRQISREAIGKATAVIFMSFLIVFLSSLLLSTVTEAKLGHILYETVSATATVGLSCNLTGSLSFFGKVIILLTMYRGRIGPLSLAIAFNTRRTNPNMIQNPTEDISIG